MGTEARKGIGGTVQRSPIDSQREPLQVNSGQREVLTFFAETWPHGRHRLARFA